MSLVLNESLVLAKTRSQDLKSVLKLNCWGSGIKDVSLVRQMVNVEVIGLSCNEITTLEDFAYCPKLKELILRNNKIKNISEVAYLQGLPKLTTLWLGENPCAENTHNYRKVVLKALPNLTILDNIPVSREELHEIEVLGNEIYEEVPYESSSSSGSGPSSSVTQSSSKNQQASELEANESLSQKDVTYTNECSAEPSQFQPYDHQDLSLANNYCNQSLLNDSQQLSSMINKTPSLNSSRLQQSRCMSSQGSVTTLNGSQHQNWSMSNNNNILPKGGVHCAPCIVGSEPQDSGRTTRSSARKANQPSKDKELASSSAQSEQSASPSPRVRGKKRKKIGPSGDGSDSGDDDHKKTPCSKPVVNIKEEPVCSCPKNVMKCIGILPSMPIISHFPEDSDSSHSSIDGLAYKLPSITPKELRKESQGSE